MFWPPSFASNNSVTIYDAKYAAEEEAAERFPPFTQAACVIAPWLARTDQDTRWVPGDPMCRILLIGEPTHPLFSFNANSHGSIIEFGSVHAGTQRWEVVSYFDWYVDDDAGKVGCLAWCRLWTPGVGEDEDPDPPGIDENEEHGSFAWNDNEEGDFEWEVPEGVVAVEAYCIGGGGGGEVGGNLAAGGSAGGGGACSFKLLAVTPGSTISGHVGEGGVSGTPGASGNSTWFSSILVCKAAPGAGGGSAAAGVGGVGGQIADCVGDVMFAGGHGGGGTELPNHGGGGGGGGASDTADGDDGNNGSGDTNGTGGAEAIGVNLIGGEGGQLDPFRLPGQTGGGGAGGGSGGGDGTEQDGGCGIVFIVW